MDIKGRLKQIRDYAGMGQTNFEKHTGISIGYFNKLKGSIGSDTILKIVDKYPEINIDWLITGKGEMLKDNNPMSSKTLGINRTSGERNATVSVGNNKGLVNVGHGNVMNGLGLKPEDKAIIEIEALKKEIENITEKYNSLLRENELLKESINDKEKRISDKDDIINLLKGNK